MEDGTRAPCDNNNNYSNNIEREKNNIYYNNVYRLLRSYRFVVAVATALVIVILAHGRSASRSHRRRGNRLLTCPRIQDLEATNDSGESFDEYYGKVSRNITTDKNDFLATFRTKDYDGWGKTYDVMKEGMKPFKSEYFLPYLKKGSKIYESACGIGLNLLMTLEILQEESGKSNGSPGTAITVYGNEYVQESVELSDMVLGKGVLPAGNRRGAVCQGDSTNLSHVPSDAFDLVFTGYITPIQDPLGIDQTDDWGKYTAICRTLKDARKYDWMGQALWNIALEKQHDWYGKWVGEMARIAKPGAPVIVEQVSQNYCTNQDDWGGVNMTFWHQAAADNTYNWNIDPDSIEMVDDTLHGMRYHVFMLKNEGL